MKLIQCRKLKPELKVKQGLAPVAFDLEIENLNFYISDIFIHWVTLEVSKNEIMEKTKNRSVSSPVVFSSIFLSVVCLSGLIHVEMELHVHRQMLQVLNQQTEEKLEQRSRNRAHEDKESFVKMPHSESNKGEY